MGALTLATCSETRPQAGVRRKILFCAHLTRFTTFIKTILNLDHVKPFVVDLAALISIFSNSGVRRTILQKGFANLETRTAKFTTLNRGIIDKVWWSHTDSFQRLLHPDTMAVLSTFKTSESLVLTNERYADWSAALTRVTSNLDEYLQLLKAFNEVKIAVLLLRVQSQPTVSRALFLFKFIESVMRFKFMRPNQRMIKMVAKEFDNVWHPDYISADLRRRGHSLYPYRPFFVAAALLDLYEQDILDFLIPRPKEEGETCCREAAKDYIRKLFNFVFPEPTDDESSESNETRQLIFDREYTNLRTAIRAAKKKKLREDGTSLQELYGKMLRNWGFLE